MKAKMDGKTIREIRLEPAVYKALRSPRPGDNVVEHSDGSRQLLGQVSKKTSYNEPRAFGMSGSYEVFCGYDNVVITEDDSEYFIDI